MKIKAKNDHKKEEISVINRKSKKKKKKEKRKKKKRKICSVILKYRCS